MDDDLENEILTSAPSTDKLFISDFSDFDFDWIESDALIPPSKEIAPITNSKQITIEVKNKEEMADLSRTISIAYQTGEAEITLSSGTKLTIKII